MSPEAKVRLFIAGLVLDVSGGVVCALLSMYGFPSDLSIVAWLGALTSIVVFWAAVTMAGYDGGWR